MKRHLVEVFKIDKRFKTKFRLIVSKFYSKTSYLKCIVRPYVYNSCAFNKPYAKYKERFNYSIFVDNKPIWYFDENFDVKFYSDLDSLCSEKLNKDSSLRSSMSSSYDDIDEIFDLPF